MSLEFDIKPMVSQIGASVKGKTLQVLDVSYSQNNRGDQTPTETAYSIDGIIQIMTTEEDDVLEGRLDPGDIIGFFSEDETNIGYLKKNNRINYDGRDYRITDIIENDGHVEIMAKKL